MVAVAAVLALLVAALSALGFRLALLLRSLRGVLAAADGLRSRAEPLARECASEGARAAERARRLGSRP